MVEVEAVRNGADEDDGLEGEDWAGEMIFADDDSCGERGHGELDKQTRVANDLGGGTFDQGKEDDRDDEGGEAVMEQAGEKVERWFVMKEICESHAEEDRSEGALHDFELAEVGGCIGWEQCI